MNDIKPYTGAHCLVEFHQAQHLDDLKLITAALQQAAVAGGARVLRIDTHHFGESMGVAGVALLAESHISIHTWPEFGYAAIDVFLCGRNNSTTAAIQELRKALQPKKESIATVKRGYGVMPC